jgi:hypothetical protein
LPSVIKILELNVVVIFEENIDGDIVNDENVSVLTANVLIEPDTELIKLLFIVEANSVEFTVKLFVVPDDTVCTLPINELIDAVEANSVEFTI